MKKRKLKKWVEYTLVTINAFMFIIMASECEDLKIFITSHVIALIIFAFNSYILGKYTDIYDIED